MGYHGWYKDEKFCPKGCNDKKYFDRIGVLKQSLGYTTKCPICGTELKEIK